MQNVYEYIQKHRMIKADDKVVVGVSGGADSLCLLFLLKEYQREVPFDIQVVHVEHGIRGGESLADATFVGDLCKKENMAFRCVRIDAPSMARKEGLTLEEAARKARYEIFDEVCKETGANRLALAHNQNDQAETMLFQMARGSGLAGAGGIRPVRKVWNADATKHHDSTKMYTIIRPLLNCSRTEIEEYLQERRIAWRNDSTNQDVTYTRNSVRYEILPKLIRQVNEQTVRHMATLGEELQSVEEYMTQQARIIMKNMVTIQNRPEELALKTVCLDRNVMQEQPKIMQEYIIRESLKEAGCGLKDITRGHIESILSLANMQSGKRITLPGGWAVWREFKELVIRHDEPDTQVMRWVDHGTGSNAGKSSNAGQSSDAVQWDTCRNIALLDLPCEIPIRDETYTFRILENHGQKIPQKIYTKWFDYDIIAASNWELTLRTRRPGDMLTVDSRGGRQKLKKYFIEEKIPQRKREEILLLAQGPEVLWVMGYRINEAFKVTEHTKQILEVQRRM